jgi:hypothetical protein
MPPSPESSVNLREPEASGTLVKVLAEEVVVDRDSAHMGSLMIFYLCLQHFFTAFADGINDSWHNTVGKVDIRIGSRG